MKLFSNVTRMLVIAVFALLALVPTSASAQTPYRPNFSAGAQVYIDPAVANHPDFPVSLPGLESKLKDAGSAHGVVYIAVAVQQTTERGGGNLAADWLDQLLLRWGGANGFPSDNYVLMVWMRSASNPSEGWVAVNAGANLKNYGLGKSMLDAADGPVVPAVRKYMPQDPKGAFLGIAGGVNKVIDDYNAAQQSAKERSDFMGQLPIYFLILLVAGGGVAFFVVRSRGVKDLKAQVEPLFNEWNEKMESANALYLKLRGGYLGFIQDQSDWKGKFSGSTKAQYEAALTNFADFSARRSKANAHLEEARKLWQKGDYKGVREMLQDQTITVTGADIALEDATLFGGLVVKNDYKPSELLNSMATLFDQTNKALAGIMKSLNEALAAGSELDAVQADIEMKWAQAGDKSFAPHRDEFDAINVEEAQVRLNYKSDPLAGKAAMLALVARAKAIQSKLAA
jgi:hypothetical protein